MFIKLTKLDNSPVWLNASFVVTVEPRRGGGSIVVPIGDGLDYEVRENAESVLGMLDKAPAPTVVPVPVSDCLTQTPADVSPEPAEPEPKVSPRIERAVAAACEPVKPSEPPAEPVKVEEETKPARKTTRKTAAKAKTAAKPRKRATKKSAESDEQPPADDSSGPAPAESETAPNEAAPVPSPVAAVPSPVAAETPVAIQEVAMPVPKLELNESQIDRLKKLMPRSVRKLANTLIAQFRVPDPQEVIRALQLHGVLRLDCDRVLWG